MIPAPLFACSVKLLFALIVSHVVMRCYGSVHRRFLSAGLPFCRRSVVMILSCYLSFVDSCAVVCVQRNVVVCLDLKSFRHALLWLRDRRFLSAGSPLCRRSVVMILSCYLSFVDSCARVPMDSSCARVPVCPWIPRVPVCPCARGFLVCPCARRPVRRPISVSE